MTRRAAIAKWIFERYGTYALAADVDTLVSLRVPLGALLQHLQRGYEAGARGVGYFLSPGGLAELHELESQWRQRQSADRRGGAGWMRELLDRYSRRPA